MCVLREASCDKTAEQGVMMMLLFVDMSVGDVLGTGICTSGRRFCLHGVLNCPENRRNEDM